MGKYEVAFTILGEEYILLANTIEEEAYIQKTAGLVEEQATAIVGRSHFSRSKSMVYASMNLADLYFKEQANTINLRKEIIDSADRISKLEKELQRLKTDKPKRGAKANQEAKELKEKEAKELKELKEKEAQESQEAQETKETDGAKETEMQTGKESKSDRDAKALGQESILPTE